MIYSTEKAVRDIARRAQRKIKNKTGRTVSLMLNPRGEDTLKTPQLMMEVVAIALDKNMACYRMKSREREVVDLRFIAAVLLRTHFPYVTLQQIAVMFGGQDHSSVINGLSRAHNLIYTGDLKFMKKYNQAAKAVNLWLERMDGLAA